MPAAPFAFKEREEMALSFWEMIRPKNGTVSTRGIKCEELCAAAVELQMWELSFRICVNMIANAIGRCEFRTFKNHEEIREREYYLWNVEPNINQNSTMFLHKLISKLCTDNEVLVISHEKAGAESLIIADSFAIDEGNPTRQNEYSDVTVGTYTFRRTFKEKDVLHLQLNHIDIKPIWEKIAASYGRLVAAAMDYYAWHKGNHWKVKVDQMMEGKDDYAADFQKMINDMFKPFLNTSGSLLPEFNGYTYTNESNGSVTSADLRDLMETIFDYTARTMLIPAVLVNGKIEGTKDANTRFLTNCIDPICDQLQEENMRKRYGYDEWANGNFIRVDSSSIIHFDLFENAANVEKLVGSGAFSINDILRAANQATINEDWADAHFLTLNISTMQAAARQLGNQEGGNGT